MDEAYALAQHAMADLKVAVCLILKNGPSEGMQNADISRRLGLHTGYRGRTGEDRQKGHIARTILELMENEEVVRQDQKTKLWTIR